MDGQSLLPRKASECPPRDSASMGQPKNDRANRSTIVIAFLHGHCPALGPLIYGEHRTRGPAPTFSLSSAGRSIDRLVISFGDESVGLFSLVVESEQWPPRVAGRRRRVASRGDRDGMGLGEGALDWLLDRAGWTNFAAVDNSSR